MNNSRKYAIFTDNGKWFVEMQENRESFWTIITDPFDDEGQANNALVKLQDDAARAEYDTVAKLDTGEPAILVQQSIE